MTKVEAKQGSSRSIKISQEEKKNKEGIGISINLLDINTLEM